MLRFKRRIGPLCCVRGRRSERNLLSRQSPDFAKPIGRRFTVFFATAVFRPLTRRISSKVSLPSSLSKTH